MRWYFFDRDGALCFTRSDAESFTHCCEEMSCEGVFPLRKEKAIAPGMLIGWQDDDDLWEVHEIETAESDGYGERLTLTGVHIAAAILQGTLLPSVQCTNVSIGAAVQQIIGSLPVQCDAGSGASVCRVSTQGGRLRLRSGPGTSYRVIGLYANGTQVTLRGSKSGGWSKVETPDARIGWMYTAYLTGASASPADGTCVTLNAAWVTAWDALRDAADQAGRLVIPRAEVAGRRVQHAGIDLRRDTAEYRGVRLSVGTGLISAGVKTDLSPVYTAMVGLGKNDMTFASAVWSRAGGDPADKPKGDTAVSLPDAVYTHLGAARTGLVRFDAVSDASELLARTYEALKQASVPAVRISCTCADLYSLGYGGQSMRLHDMVYVILKPLDFRIAARITGLTRDLVHPENTRPTIGTAQSEDIVRMIAGKA